MKASASARGDAATKRCEDLISMMKNASLFDRNVPTIVALVDVGGKVVGRNGSNLNRGDDMAGTYAGLKSTLTTGQSGSDVWHEHDRYLASYVAVHDEQGKIIGALVIGRPLNDTLARASEATSGRALAVVVPTADGFEVIAHSAQQAPGLDENIGKAKEMLKNALGHQQTDTLREGDVVVAAAPLSAFEDGKRALLVATTPASLVQDPTGLALLPILGATAVGIILVIIGGWLLGNYITGPISTLEKRACSADPQRAVRQALRAPCTPSSGARVPHRSAAQSADGRGRGHDRTPRARVSKAPSAANFTDALGVEDKRAVQGEVQMDPAAIQVLAAEAAPQYYARIFPRVHRCQEGARRGDGPHHGTDVLVAHPEHAEQDAAARIRAAVRYQVQSRAKEVVLIAVPLGPSPYGRGPLTCVALWSARGNENGPFR